jgi:Zn-dependent peptidase ImmA (M78 family)
MGDELFVILSVGFTLFCACGLVNECLKDHQQQNLSMRQESKPRVAYSKIIKEVVRFSGPLLLNEGIKRYPRLKVSYRRCKGADGYYYPKSKTIEVLVNKQVDTSGLVFVTLHELAHYIQDKTDPDFRNYDVYEHRFGYDANKFEIEANRFASDYQTSCLKHLESNGFI